MQDGYPRQESIEPSDDLLDVGLSCATLFGSWCAILSETQQALRAAWLASSAPLEVERQGP